MLEFDDNTQAARVLWDYVSESVREAACWLADVKRIVSDPDADNQAGDAAIDAAEQALDDAIDNLL